MKFELLTLRISENYWYLSIGEVHRDNCKPAFNLFYFEWAKGVNIVEVLGMCIIEPK